MNIIESPVAIETPDGIARGIFFHGETSLPGVIFLTDIAGIRPSVAGMARRLAEGHTPPTVNHEAEVRHKAEERVRSTLRLRPFRRASSCRNDSLPAR